MPTPSSSPGDAPERQPPPASANAKVNLAYLALGSKATVAPSSIATRSFLTTLRCVDSTTSREGSCRSLSRTAQLSLRLAALCTLIGVRADEPQVYNTLCHKAIDTVRKVRGRRRCRCGHRRRFARYAG
jgi:hypothetical protein